MSITTYSELQTAVANWLNRNDLTSRIPEFIALAEAELNRDDRIQLISSRDFTTSDEEYSLPTDFRTLRNLYIDEADVRYGIIETVRPNELAETKSIYGNTGVPRACAIISGGTPSLRFAPEPDQTYDFRMTYEGIIEALSDTDPTNRFLDEAPDIYLYASLVAAEPFLQEDQRVALWRQELERKIQRLQRNQRKKNFGGRMTMMPRVSLGE